MAGLNVTKLVTRNKRKEAVIAAEKTTNFHGEVAYKLGDKAALIEKVVGAFWNEDLFYQKGQKTSNEIVTLVRKVAKGDPKFPLQLAAWARNELYLRTTPQVLLVESANIEASKPFIREYAPKIVKRADELADVIAYQLSAHGKPIPNALKKGLSAAFSQFDEYQLNKYDSNKGAVSLGDVLRLIERKTNYPVSKAMYDYLVHDKVDADALPKIGALKKLLTQTAVNDETLALAKQSSVTWETFISHFGSTKENWEIVIPNMGYMALLRNLRNFEEKGVDLTPVLETIANPEKVRRSKQLPYRFWSAYNQVANQKVKRAIAQAFEHSVSNVKLAGKTVVIVDHSGSMDSHLSDKSAISYYEVGAVLGAIAVKKSEESLFVQFGDSAAYVELNPDDTMMTNIQKMRPNTVGHSTNAWAALDLIKNQKLDRVILISDMQCYNSYKGGYGYSTSSVEDVWNKIRAKNPNAYLYSLDVSAYGTKQIPSTDNHAVTINGWSDKVLDFINLVEKQDVMEAEISKY